MGPFSAVKVGQKSHATDKLALGPDHPKVTYPLYGLAKLYLERARYEEAEPLFQRALHIREQALGLDHPETAYPLHGLAKLCKTQGKYKKAESLYRCAHVAQKTPPQGWGITGVT